MAFKDGDFTLLDQYNTPIRDCGIQTVYVDRHNTKWFITSRGNLYSFDNSVWKEYSVPEWLQLTTCFADDPNGRVWVGTREGRLMCVNNGALIDSELNFGGPRKALHWGGTPEFLVDMDVDRRGRLWIAFEKALVSFDGEHWISYWCPPLSTGRLTRIRCRHDRDAVYLGATDGVYTFDGERCQKVDGLPDGAVTGLWLHPDGRLFVAYRDDRCVVVEKDGSISSFANDTPIARQPVSGIAFDVNSALWFLSGGVGSYGSIHRLAGAVWSSYVPKEPELTEVIPIGNRLAWQRKSPVDWLNEPSIDADPHDVVGSPAQYLNQKLRIVGRYVVDEREIDSGEFVDRNGDAASIFPIDAPPLYAFHDDHVRRYFPRNNGLQELVGYIEWGGCYPMGAEVLFTIVEAYPIDATPEQKAEIKKAYLTSFKSFVDAKKR
jgi:hypothetical protein